MTNAIHISLSKNPNVPKALLGESLPDSTGRDISGAKK
jgi:hypothetical protein